MAAQAQPGDLVKMVKPAHTHTYTSRFTFRARCRVGEIRIHTHPEPYTARKHAATKRSVCAALHPFLPSLVCTPPRRCGSLSLFAASVTDKDYLSYEVLPGLQCLRVYCCGACGPGSEAMHWCCTCEGCGQTRLRMGVPSSALGAGQGRVTGLLDAQFHQPRQTVL